MLKPPMPNAAGMTDTLEFVKNLWGGMHVPGVTAPGMGGSTEELDKKIADLKAVESWLNLNLGMLRGTIQAMEVQRGTLATLKAMGDSMAQAMQRAGADPALAQPFAQFFAQSAQSPAAPAPSAPPPQGSAAPAASEGATAASDPSQAGAAMPAAVAWWNMLQDQFRQAVASAMPPGAAPQDSAAQPPAEPKARGGSPLDVSGGAPEAAPASPPVHGARVGKNPRTKVGKA